MNLWRRSLGEALGGWIISSIVHRLNPSDFNPVRSVCLKPRIQSERSMKHHHKSYFFMLSLEDEPLQKVRLLSGLFSTACLDTLYWDFTSTRGWMRLPLPNPPNHLLITCIITKEAFSSLVENKSAILVSARWVVTGFKGHSWTGRSDWPRTASWSSTRHPLFRTYPVFSAKNIHTSPVFQMGILGFLFYTFRKHERCDHFYSDPLYHSLTRSIAPEMLQWCDTVRSEVGVVVRVGVAV